MELKCCHEKSEIINQHCVTSLKSSGSLKYRTVTPHFPKDLFLILSLHIGAQLSSLTRPLSKKLFFNFSHYFPVSSRACSVYLFPNLRYWGTGIRNFVCTVLRLRELFTSGEVATPTKTPYKYGGQCMCKGCLVSFCNTRMSHRFDRKVKKNREEKLKMSISCTALSFVSR
jgi:hypothetical protein